MNRAALSAASASMAPPRCDGLLAMTPSGRPSIRTSAVTMPTPNDRRSSSTESVSAMVSITRADVVDAEPVLGDDVAQQLPGPGGPSRRPGPGSTTGTAWPRATASASSATATSTTPLGTCTLIGPTSSGAKTPRPPPSIIAGPPMPMFASAVAMITSQQPRMAALPAKQRPDVMPTSGTRPLRAPNRAKAMQSRPDTPLPSVSPGRPPPPSVKNTTGRRRRSASSNRRSFLRWFCRPWVPASTV